MRGTIAGMLVIGLGLGLETRAFAQPAPTSPPTSPPSAEPAPPPSAPPPAPALPTDLSTILRDANAAAIAGDWPRVAALVDPLIYAQPPRPLATGDRAEADRLAGLAAFFLQQQTNAADVFFLDYLRLDPDAHLDPTLYPPEVVTHFEDVRSRHASELRARRPHAKRYLVYNIVPPIGMYQNGEHTKAWITGGLIVGFAATNVVTYLVLRGWCNDVGSTCDADGTDHTKGARDLRVVNYAAGIGLIATYAWGLYDGVTHYRRHEREDALELQLFAAPTTNGASGATFGVGGRF